MHTVGWTDKRWAVVRVGVLVLVAGVLALPYLCAGCNGTSKRTQSQVQKDITSTTRRRANIERQLEDYGGHVENGQWQMDYVGTLTRTGTRQDINNLINQWHNCNDELTDLHDEYGDARPDTGHTDATHGAANSATNVRPTTAQPHHH